MQTESKWLLLNDNNPVCTFVPKVLELITMWDCDSKEEYIRLNLEFKEGEAKEVTLPLSKIEQVKWEEQDKRCIICPHYKNANKYIATVIRSDLNGVMTKVQYIPEKLGIYYIKNEAVFIAGDRVITQSLHKNLESDIYLRPSPFKLEIDMNITKRKAFEGMRTLINLAPEISSVLVAHIISGFIREAYKKARFIPCAVLVIVGKSGMLKSHYVSHLTQLYNRTDEIKTDTRFNSTTRFIEDILYEHSECTTVIDDLHSAGAKSIKRTNETTAEEIIRRISDDTGRGHKEGNAVVQRKFRGNVVFIGEYDTGQGSTMPRALVVSLTKRIDGAVLDIYQRQQPLLVSTFYYHFICWYVEYFEDICKWIDGQLTKFRKISTNSCIHGRLRDTQFYLQTSYMIFLEFCKDSKFISEKDALDESDVFSEHLRKLIQKQQERYEQNKARTEDINYLKLIRNLYRKGKFQMADSEKTFRKDKHDGLLYYNCLCLRREKLEKKLHKISPDIRINDVVQQLIEMKALKYSGEKRTVKISTLNKSEGACRFYAIRL